MWPVAFPPPTIDCFALGTCDCNCANVVVVPEASVPSLAFFLAGASDADTEVRLDDDGAPPPLLPLAPNG